MEQSELQEKLVSYMNSAANLAEQVRDDLRKGDKYSNETVLKLSQFIQESEKVSKFFDLLESRVVKYN